MRRAIFHHTSVPYRFFGRRDELALLDRALFDSEISLIAFVGPGGQGKTAIVQHWLDPSRPSTPLPFSPSALHPFSPSGLVPDGIFFWGFYRGKDSDLCLRELYACAEGLDKAPDSSASFCVDRLLPRLRKERWAIVLDGAEVVQHEQGSWRGRFVHPELGRLLEELAGEPMPGVVVLTTRFELPTLEKRRHARLLSLSTLDLESSGRLLESLGVKGTQAQVEAAARSCGCHAKAVELLATYLARYREGAAAAQTALPFTKDIEASDEERHVARILGAFQAALAADEKDVLALATAFRQPPAEDVFLAYLQSRPLAQLLHDTWKRDYRPFAERTRDDLAGIVQTLIDLRLLERVRLALADETGQRVLDAHPLVRRGFEHVLGSQGKEEMISRAGFLRGRPGRRPPDSMEAAREEIELFHAYCDAGLWNEADGIYLGLDNPKHRFVAPAFERDLLLRFFPAGDWRQPPVWEGFGRHRSLAICMEMLGDYKAAIEIYRPADAALQGDALLALGRLEPMLAQPQAAAPWQTLWQAYRVHALALAGREAEALREVGRLVPTDIYEWVHLFEALLRLGRLDLLDLPALKYRPPFAQEHAWTDLARRRMLADYERLHGDPACSEATLRELVEAYDRGGLPWERALVRLSLGRCLLQLGKREEAKSAAWATHILGRRYSMPMMEIDALDLSGEIDARRWGIRATPRP